MHANPDIALAFSAQRGMRGRASSRRPRTISPIAELGNSAVPRKDFNFRTIQIIPSVLPADLANMGQCVNELEASGVDRIQFDVMDGNFVPNLTFGPKMIKSCWAEGFLFWTFKTVLLCIIHREREGKCVVE
jgi:hypothetical protein